MLVFIKDLYNLESTLQASARYSAVEVTSRTMICPDTRSISVAVLALPVPLVIAVSGLSIVTA